MELEFCAENFTNVPKAIKRGATRIELCDNLAKGGTTPSYGVIEQTVKYAKEHDVKVMTIIRPRGGDFVYGAEEHAIMKRDLELAKNLGSHGVVFGCLTPEGSIARDQMQELLALSGEMETTFHMAFDEISRDQQKEELDWLVEQNVTRILTHGGREGAVLDHADWLNELTEYADGRIDILVGGGVTYKNVQELSKRLSTTQFHGTRIVNVEEA